VTPGTAIETPGAAIGEGLALIETLAPFASHRVSFDRDPGDSFAVTVDRLRPRGPDVGHDVGHDELLPLLPRGSQWNAAVGWRSFVVLPFESPGVQAAVVAVEGVVPHATRGAFPILHGFLIGADDVSPALGRLVGGLSTRGLSAGFPDQRWVIWSSDAQSPSEHQRHEPWMLSVTADAWRRGEPRLLRTVVLSDDQAPWPRSWGERLRAVASGGGSRPYLVATVPPIRAHFSRSTRLALFWRDLLA
jgi:hypothetical protein